MVVEFPAAPLAPHAMITFHSNNSLADHAIFEFIGIIFYFLIIIISAMSHVIKFPFLLNFGNLLRIHEERICRVGTRYEAIGAGNN